MACTPKLSRDERDWLEVLASRHAYGDGPILRRLARRNLAERMDSTAPEKGLPRYIITDAGRSALRAQ